MSGIGLAVIADELVAAYGGSVETVSEYEWQVNGSSLGDFKVDLDFEYLQKIGRGDFDREWSREIEELAADALQALMTNVIPCELITPPLAFERLGELDVVVDRLRERGASGTRQALFAAFGMHLNPELPDLEAATILAFLRAFVCLRAWLEAREEVALSRKISLFIRSYPTEYEELILDEDYAPSLEELTNDYLKYNASRNRMLDLLPLLAHLDEERVRASVGGQKLRKRPTFHYRLPNSDIDNVVLGGSLFADIRSMRRLTSNRRTPLPRKTALAEADGILRRTIGSEQWRINSLHSQAIERLGEGLRVVARDLDSFVQAIESARHRWLVGGQWHPEYLFYLRGQRRMFRDLVARARETAPESLNLEDEE